MSDFSDNGKDAKINELRAEISHKPEYERMSAGRYLSTRFSSLKPPMTPLANPFALLAMLNLQQWLFFLVAFAGWTWDAFDFFSKCYTLEQVFELFSPFVQLYL